MKSNNLWILLRIRVLLKAIFVLSTVFAITSCSSSFEWTINALGGGTVKADISLTPELRQYLEDLSSLDPTIKTQLLSSTGLREGLDAHGQLLNPNVLVNPEGTKLSVGFGFNSLAELQEPARKRGIAPIFILQQEKGERILTFLLTKRNFSALSGLTPLGNNPMLEELLPSQGQTLTQVEYKEMLEYMLESYSSKPTALIMGSRVELVMVLPSAVLSTSLGRAEGNKVIISLPLLDLLVLEKPLAGTIRY